MTIVLTLVCDRCGATVPQAHPIGCGTSVIYSVPKGWWYHDDEHICPSCGFPPLTSISGSTSTSCRPWRSHSASIRSRCVSGLVKDSPARPAVWETLTMPIALRMMWESSTS
jgi:ribosomal protein L37E